MSTTSIRSSFSFTLDELVANRDGYATLEQVRQKTTLQRNEVIFLTGICGTLLLLVPFSNHILSSDIERNTWRRFVPIVSVITVAGVLYYGLFLTPKRRDRQARIVACVSGTLVLEKYNIKPYKEQADERTTPYFAQVGGKEFPITYYQYRALEQHQQTKWKIYYFPRSQIIASLEPVQSHLDYFN